LQKEITYTVPNSADVGDYEAVSYLWWAGEDGEFGTGDEQVVSDTSTTTFTVASSDSGDDSGSSDDSTDDSMSPPNVEEYARPTVRVEDDAVVGTVYFENTGDAMMESNVVEMQVRDPGTSPLNFLDSHARTCDSAHPENVHREYMLDSGEAASAELRTDAVTKGEEKVVYFLTRTACAQDRDGAGRVDPYPYSYNAGTVCIDCGDDGGNDSGSGGGGIPFVAVIGGAVLLIAGGVILRE
jgi:hypothetical protein